jgi:hypothetical protein
MKIIFIGIGITIFLFLLDKNILLVLTKIYKNSVKERKRDL